MSGNMRPDMEYESSEEQRDNYTGTSTAEEVERMRQ